MASIHQEIMIAAPTEFVWDVLRDVGAVHQRLLPGRVTATRIEGNHRFLTFPGHIVHELIISVNDDRRRLAYAVVEGARPPAEFHQATFEVRPEGDRSSRLIWTTDVLPHGLAGVIRIRMERGAEEMRAAIEGAQLANGAKAVCQLSETQKVTTPPRLKSRFVRFSP